MKAFLQRGCLVWLLACGWPALLHGAEESWVKALRAMPLPPGATLNRSNAVEVLLNAFPSNTVLKAMVVLPGVSDDFYLIHRDAPALNLRAANLWEGIVALTNATPVRVTWREPLVLLHAGARESLQASIRIGDAAMAGRLKLQHLPGRVLHLDAHWETLQPSLERVLGRRVRPEGASAEAWHFNRHNVAGWHLTGWELLEAVSLTGGTAVTVQKLGINFQIRDTP